MTDLRKAAEMALEAFEVLDRRGGLGLDVHEYIRTKIEALRQALAQPDEVLAEREACAKLCDDRVDAEYATGKVDHNEMGWTQACAQAIRARSEKRPVKSYCGGKPNYCTPEATPDVDTVNTSQARVEYDRQGNIARLFGPIEPDGTLLYTAPPKRECVDAVNISQERVDETAKREHEPVAYVTIEPALDGDWRKCPSIKWFNKPTGGPLYTAPPKREWVGLTSDDVHDAFNYVEMVKWLDFDSDRPDWCEAFASACEATLRHKNGGNK